MLTQKEVIVLFHVTINLNLVKSRYALLDRAFVFSPVARTADGLNLRIIVFNRIMLMIYDKNSRNDRIKTRKERKYSFPIRAVLLYRLKVRMRPFKNAEKPAKIVLEKFMDIVALFIMPLSYIIFKDWCCEFHSSYC